MNQKGFVNIVLIIVVVAIAGAIGYFALIKKPNSTAPANQVTPPPTISTEPSIKVTFPNGGEKLTDGKEYTIVWKSDNAPKDSKVFLFIAGIIKGQESWGYAPSNTLLSPSGEYKWTARNSGEYRIKVQLVNPTLFKLNAAVREGIFASDESDLSFTVVSPAEPYSLKVLFPNGGEQFETGKTYQIKWSSNNIPPTAKIRVGYKAIEVSSESDSYEIATTNNSGVLTWTTPKEIYFLSTKQCYDVVGGRDGGATEVPKKGVVVAVPTFIEINWINEYGNYQKADTSDKPFVLTGPCSGWVNSYKDLQ